MTKKDIIQLLEKIAVYMELKGENTFKVSAYRKAAQSLETTKVDINGICEINISAIKDCDNCVWMIDKGYNAIA